MIVSSTREVFSRLHDACVPGLDRHIVFIHIPKCASNSVHTAIAKYYPRRKKVKLSAGASRQAADFLGRELLEHRLNLLTYELETMGRGRFVSGHYPVNEQLCNNYGNRWDFVTMLRHPVDRYISQYFFNLKADGPFGVSLPLDQFIGTERGISWGRQYVRQLTWETGRSEQRDETERIVSACRVLDRFSVVGCVKKLDSFGSMFEKLFKVKPKISRENVGLVSQKVRDTFVTPELRQSIEEVCEPDLRVYRYIEQQLET